MKTLLGVLVGLLVGLLGGWVVGVGAAMYNVGSEKKHYQLARNFADIVDGVIF